MFFFNQLLNENIYLQKSLHKKKIEKLLFCPTTLILKTLLVLKLQP